LNLKNDVWTKNLVFFIIHINKMSRVNRKCNVSTESHINDVMMGHFQWGFETKCNFYVHFFHFFCNTWTSYFFSFKYLV